MLRGSELLDAHHPDPEAVLQDLIPTDDQDGRGRQASEVQARQVLEVFIGRPLEQDNRPPAPFTFGLGGLQNLLWVLLQVRVQAQVVLRVRSFVVLARSRGIVDPCQVVLGHFRGPELMCLCVRRRSVLHLHRPLLVHRLHQAWELFNVAPVGQCPLQGQVHQPPTESPHHGERGLHLV